MAMIGSSGVPKSGMMEIGIALVLQDRFSNQAGQASAAINKLQQEARQAVQANLNAARNIGLAGMNAFRMIASSMAEMVNYGAEYVDTMVTVNAITEATVKEMSELNDVAMSLGKNTMFSSQDIASGMKYLAMAGNTAEEIKGMIKGATYAAGATGLALGGKGGAADVITNVMRTFQLSGEQAALWVGDVMTNATLSANISMQDLAASIRYAAADMTNLGYQLPEVAAAIGTLGNMGIQGSMAGTALANMARYLNRSISDPSYKGHKFLEKVGLTKKDFVDAEGNLKDLYSIMTLIQKATVGMDASERNLFTTSIFGVRGNRAAMAMLRDMEGFKKLYDDVAGTDAGFAEQVVAKRMETIAGQLNVVKSVFQNVKAAFTAALEPLIPVLKFITKWLEGIRKILGTKVGKLIASLGVIATGVMGIASAVLVLRTKFLMFQTDSIVSGRNMFNVLVHGWREATVAATTYMEVERAIMAQRMIGIGGNPAAAVVMAKNPMVVAKKTKTGTVMYRYKKGTVINGKNMGGKFFPMKAEIAKEGLTGSVGEVASKGASKTLSKKVLSGGAKRLGFGAVLGKTSWIGWAITGLSLALPAIIGSINSHKDSTDKGKESTKDNTKAVKSLTTAYTNETSKEDKELRLAEERERNMLAIINLLTQVVRGQNKIPQFDIGTIKLSNGKTIGDYLTDDDSDANYS